MELQAFKQSVDLHLMYDYSNNKKEEEKPSFLKADVLTQIFLSGDSSKESYINVQGL